MPKHKLPYEDDEGVTILMKKLKIGNVYDTNNIELELNNHLFKQINKYSFSDIHTLCSDIILHNKHLYQDTRSFRPDCTYKDHINKEDIYNEYQSFLKNTLMIDFQKKYIQFLEKELEQSLGYFDEDVLNKFLYDKQYYFYFKRWFSISIIMKDLISKEKKLNINTLIDEFINIFRLLAIDNIFKDFHIQELLKNNINK